MPGAIYYALRAREIGTRVHGTVCGVGEREWPVRVWTSGGYGTGPGMAPASCQLKSSSYPWLCEVIYGRSRLGLRVSASFTWLP